MSHGRGRLRSTRAYRIIYNRHLLGPIGHFNSILAPEVLLSTALLHPKIRHDSCCAAGCHASRPIISTPASRTGSAMTSIAVIVSPGMVKRRRDRWPQDRAMPAAPRNRHARHILGGHSGQHHHDSERAFHVGTLSCDFSSPAAISHGGYGVPDEPACSFPITSRGASWWVMEGHPTTPSPSGASQPRWISWPTSGGGFRGAVSSPPER
jgi:hypothetical protein